MDKGHALEIALLDFIERYKKNKEESKIKKANDNR